MAVFMAYTCKPVFRYHTWILGHAQETRWGAGDQTCMGTHRASDFPTIKSLKPYI